jgi:hypothetical protein
MWLSAEGSINSGVWFTFGTPPTGWTEMRSDIAGGWLMPGVPRYGLILATTTKELPESEEWRYVGSALGSPEEPIAWELSTATDLILDAGPRDIGAGCS